MSWQLMEHSRESLKVEFQADKLDGFTLKNTAGKILDRIEEGRLASVGGEKETDFARLMSMTDDLVPYGEKIDYDFPGGLTYRQLAAPALDYVFSLDRQGMAEMGNSLLSILKEGTPEFSFDITISRSSGRSILSNSKGQIGEYGQQDFSLVVETSLFRDNDILSWHNILFSPPKSEKDITDFAAAVSKELFMIRNPVTIPAGKYPVLFAPQVVAGPLMESLFSALNPRFVHQKTSRLWDQKGARVLNETVNLHEVAVHTPFDNDGIPTCPKDFIRHGVLSSFPITLEYAARLGEAPTGSSFDRFCSDLVMDPGVCSLKELIASIEEGIILFESPNLNQGNLIGGELSGIISQGFYIKNGFAVGRLKDCSVSFQLYDLLGSQLQALSRESTRMGHHSFAQVPWILCADVQTG